MSHTEAKVDALLGQAVLCEVVPSESLAALRYCRPFPSAPKFSAPGFKFVSSDAQLTGQRNGVVKTVGGSRPVTEGNFPAPPTPRSPVTSWDVRSLTRAVLEPGLPAVVGMLVFRSAEFRALEAETPAPSGKRK